MTPFLRKHSYVHSCFLTADLFAVIENAYTAVNAANISAFLERNLPIRNKKHIQIRAINSWIFHIEVTCSTEAERGIVQQYLGQYPELFPPWLAFPGLWQGAPRWNQGYEESYGLDHWLPFWERLNLVDKKIYQKKYNCPAEWSEYLDGLKS